MWQVTRDRWHVTLDRLHVTKKILVHVTGDTWQVTCDTWHRWHVTHDTGDKWHVTQVTCDTWHMAHSVEWKFSQNVSSLALPVRDWRCLEYIWTKGWISEWINDGGDCKTAPTKQGLVIAYFMVLSVTYTISHLKMPFQRCSFYYFLMNKIMYGTRIMQKIQVQLNLLTFCGFLDVMAEITM